MLIGPRCAPHQTARARTSAKPYVTTYNTIVIADIQALGAAVTLRYFDQNPLRTGTAQAQNTS